MHPICGNYLWNNEYGATIFCKKLGFSSGTREALPHQSLPVDAYFVGKCGPADVDLTACTGGYNYRRLGGIDPTSNGRVSCDAGRLGGIKFFCGGGKGSQNSCNF